MTPNRVGILPLLAIAASTAGCTLLGLPAPESGGSAPISQPSTPPTVVDDDVSQALRYYRELQTMTEKSIERERQLNVAAVTAERCDVARLRLGLVFLRGSELSMRQEIPDDLLKPCLIDPTLADTSSQNLAHLLQAQLREASSTNARYRSAVQEAEMLRKENTELKRQLDGLKAIERSLQDRRRRQTEEPNGNPH